MSARSARQRYCWAGFWLGWTLLLCGPGCSSTAFQEYRQSPANPATWVRSLFPPEGETFYSERSHEIERSLNRK
jgi:hypothetical protein